MLAQPVARICEAGCVNSLRNPLQKRYPEYLRIFLPNCGTLWDTPNEMFARQDIITAKSRGKITREIAARHHWKGSRAGVKIKIMQASELPLIAAGGKSLLWEVSRGATVFSGTADTVFEAAEVINVLPFQRPTEPKKAEGA
jgi:hypothetical protein